MRQGPSTVLTAFNLRCRRPLDYRDHQRIVVRCRCRTFRLACPVQLSFVELQTAELKLQLVGLLQGVFDSACQCFCLGPDKLRSSIDDYLRRVDALDLWPGCILLLSLSIDRIAEGIPPALA